MGKGSKPRPLAVKKDIFDDNWNQISWNTKKKQQEEQVKKETKDDNISK
jgi:hypothetical protein